MSYSYRIAFLALIGLLLSGYTFFHHVEVTGGYRVERSFCSLSATIDCEAVTKSAYAVFAGVPVAGWAVVYYVAVLIVATSFARLPWPEKGEPAESVPSELPGTLSFADRGRVLFFLTAANLIPTLAFFLISEFVLGKLCLLCCGMYLANLLLAVVGWMALQPPRRIAADFTRGAGQLFGVVGSGVKGVPLLLGVAIALGGAISGTKLLTHFYFEPRAEARRDGLALVPPFEQWRVTPVEQIPIQTALSSEDRDFAKGPENAPITIVEFSDFECPFCKRAAAYLDSIVEKYGADVRLVYKSYPLDQSCNPRLTRKLHEYSCRAAAVARCVGLQSDAAFWKVYHELMEMNSFSEEAIDLAAGRAGADMDRLKACVASGAGQKGVTADLELGGRLNINSTPTIYINGRMVAGHGLITPFELLEGLVGRIREEILHPSAINATPAQASNR